MIDELWPRTPATELESLQLLNKSIFERHFERAFKNFESRLERIPKTMQELVDKLSKEDKQRIHSFVRKLSPEFPDESTLFPELKDRVLLNLYFPFLVLLGPEILSEKVRSRIVRCCLEQCVSSREVISEFKKLSQSMQRAFARFLINQNKLVVVDDDQLSSFEGQKARRRKALIESNVAAFSETYHNNELSNFRDTILQISKDSVCSRWIQILEQHKKSLSELVQSLGKSGRGRSGRLNFLDDSDLKIPDRLRVRLSDWIGFSCFLILKGAEEKGGVKFELFESLPEEGVRWLRCEMLQRAYCHRFWDLFSSTELGYGEAVTGFLRFKAKTNDANDLEELRQAFETRIIEQHTFSSYERDGTYRFRSVLITKLTDVVSEWCRERDQRTEYIEELASSQTPMKIVEHFVEQRLNCFDDINMNDLVKIDPGDRLRDLKKALWDCYLRVEGNRRQTGAVELFMKEHPKLCENVSKSTLRYHIKNLREQAQRVVRGLLAELPKDSFMHNYIHHLVVKHKRMLTE